jgi:excisionase family DNA binding protein
VTDHATAAAPVAPLLTARQAATVLAIGRRKLWSITASGDLPAVRIGRAVRYTQADLAAFVADHRQEARP